ncbi:hypothetical protein N9437_02900 [Acidimicrobiia bacterium]|nr:hypothetical protein [Acidimicrobiia bacterium]
MRTQLLTLDFFKYHFSKLSRKINISYTIVITFFYKRNLSTELLSIIKKNRTYLESVTEYLPEGEYDDEDNNYGIQNYIFSKLTKQIDFFPTYTDILILLLDELNENRVIYLEIGTSVFKNFQQVENKLENATLYGYDENELIHSIKDKYKLNQKIIENTNLNYHYSKGRNEIYYFKNDVLSKDGADIFKKLLHEKINVIFSDAHHREEGILSEYENIITNNLSDEFFYYFDDLNMFDVEQGVNKVFRDLKSQSSKIKFYTFWTYGWIGQYEKLHKIGLITTFDVSSIFREKNIKLPLFKEIL